MSFRTVGGTAAEQAHLDEVAAHKRREEQRKAEQRARWDAEDKAREATAAARRREHQESAGAALEGELRARFFMANEAATEADFRRLLPQMRDQELLQRAGAARNREVEALAMRHSDLMI